ncbi:hypothetical protein LWI29_023269 [Acer saccharum]|uniref:Protein kinase domain-containing protein n=1 Tax=Acer saccharum TaxID=4024 RepID=A0AA39VI22_ACESA|nr:hypothetical protein LWI29_023269 [Acer saccharum]
MRPTMATVVLMLNSYSFTLALPQQPAFFYGTRTDLSKQITVRTDSDQSKSKSVPWSVDDSSITETWKLWCDEQAAELMDPALTQSCDPTELLKYIHIGLLCVQGDPANRPPMSSVVFMLANDSMKLPKPTQPAFFVGRVVVRSDQSSSDVKTWKLWCDEQAAELMDPALTQSCDPTELLKYIHIGLLCVQGDPANRPPMSSVVFMLANDNITLPKPTQPAFFVGRVVVRSDDQSSSDVKVCTINEVTLSNVSPRYIPPPPPSSPPQTNTTTATERGSGGGGIATAIVVIIVFSTIIIITVFVALLCVLVRRRRNRKQKISSKQRRENADETETVESLQFNFSTIKVATNDFSNDNKLGQGGFGAVYKGILSDGRIIAVKRLASNSEQGELEFKNEILLVARLQHRNLVRLLGFCLEGSERLLIYEFVPNSSLDNFIFDSIKRLSLDWEKRYKIIGGIARGILYLHEDSRLRIIHRDLKASNILIDQDMNPKISDFGMARLFERDQTQADTGRVVGTFGYMAPEYVLHGNFSVKSDVFSFGVLVLEIISGQKNSSFHNGEETGDLLTFAWENWRVGTALNVIDPILRVGSSSEMMRCIHIGLLCVQENVVNRPTMASVVLMLNSYSISLPLPTKPAFFMHTTTTELDNPESTMSDQSKSRSVEYSINEVSITELDPR